MRRARSILLASTIMVAFGPLAAGCGLPQDGEPQKFALPAPADQALRQASTTTTSPAATKLQDIYYLKNSENENDEELVQVPVPIKVAASQTDEAKAVLEALKTVPQDRSQDLRTFLGESTKINSVSLQNNIADVDLVLGVQGQAQRLAIAQIVFALTDLEGVNAVRFFVNGEPSTPAGGLGATGEPLTRDNFQKLNEALLAASPTTVLPAPGG
ncbi:MAG: GerMN domain-containing protein [Actinobacteria bacterium]|nr:GerMN domain-containing protein [Actinomycetota bacterium]